MDLQCGGKLSLSGIDSHSISAYKYRPCVRQDIGRSKVKGDMTILEAGTGDLPNP
jgi:hypothetical protein